MTKHQQKQVDLINQIEKLIKNNSLKSSIVSPVDDYENDPRICLTSVHIPRKNFVSKVWEPIISPLKTIFPNCYYYSPNSLHITIKNIRVIKNPPNFTKEDILKAKEVFVTTTASHKKFNVYFYRLLLFPKSLALVGTTDEEFDSIILDLDRKLKDVGLPDDKKYTSTNYFFSNITLARFTSPVSNEFRQKVLLLSQSLSFKPYCVDSVTLLTTNAVFKRRGIVDTWKLQ